MEKIKNSLSAKVFLGVAALLTLCSLLIYGIVMLVIPNRYISVTNSIIAEEINVLSQSLENSDYETSAEAIEDFCLKTASGAVLVTGDKTTGFGDTDNAGKNTVSTSFVLHFSDIKEESFLTVISPASTADELNNTFLQMLPFIGAAIVIISLLSAAVCSRAIVRPVLKISSVSKRMAQMDMTWRCELNRTDELGILADSLNTMSERLSAAMGELELTNRRLKQEVETVNAMEKQRRDFFAAASHELKTPITVLKGQIESMIYGIGRYKDTQAVLPEALKEIENMEKLTREILSVTKLEIAEVHKRENIPLHEILKNTVQLLAPLAEEKETEISGDIKEVWITGNGSMLRRAVHNILSNALLHSPRGSEVSFSLDRNRLRVVNTNVTLPDEMIPHLFDPFYRVEKSRSRATGGSGLGLYLVKTVLDLHNIPCSLSNGDNCVIFTAELLQ